MWTTTVTASGLLSLGVDAEAAGYTPDTLVDVVVLSTGSLLIQKNDQHPLVGVATNLLTTRNTPRKRFYLREGDPNG